MIFSAPPTANLGTLIANSAFEESSKVSCERDAKGESNTKAEIEGSLYPCNSAVTRERRKEIKAKQGKAGKE